MRYTIEGFSQEQALKYKKQVTTNGKERTIKIDCADLVILRWFVDFFPNMRKMSVDGKEYAWLSHKKLQEDLPILDISKRSCIERMQKLVEFEILDYRCLKEGGTFSLYCFGKNYESMISSNPDGMQSNADGMQSTDIGGMQSNVYGGMQSTDIGVCSQPATKDISIKNTSIRHSSIEDINNVVGYLNEKANANYRASGADTQKHINARLAEGFTLDDFYTVIDKKCAEWVGTDFEQYLRPSTLFGTKFEAYLNAPEKRQARGNTGNGNTGSGNIFLDLAKEEGLL